MRVGKKNPKNSPGKYHNGGLWPFMNGFWVLAAKKIGNQQAAEQWTDGIDKANALNNYEFCEFRDGITGQPGGSKGQAWNAAGYVLSHTKLDLFIREN